MDEPKRISVREVLLEIHIRRQIEDPIHCSNCFLISALGFMEVLQIQRQNDLFSKFLTATQFFATTVGWVQEQGLNLMQCFIQHNPMMLGQKV
jgi:hypothetical protein